MFIELHELAVRHLIQVCHIVSVEPYSKGDRGVGSKHVGCQVHTVGPLIICDESYDEVKVMLNGG